MDRSLIDRYEADADLPARSIAGLSPDDLKAFPGPGAWSVQQVILHLMDSDLIGADRMKRVAAEPKPPALIGYDETAFASQLHYHDQDPVTACEVFRLNRRRTATVLRRLPDEAFAKIGNHSERGPETLEQLVRDYVEHARYHLKFISDKRARLGKPWDVPT
jgi:uncharacterized damage-inducible protein DinB